MVSSPLFSSVTNSLGDNPIEQSRRRRRCAVASWALTALLNVGVCNALLGSSVSTLGLVMLGLLTMLFGLLDVWISFGTVLPGWRRALLRAAALGPILVVLGLALAIG